MTTCSVCHRALLNASHADGQGRCVVCAGDGLAPGAAPVSTRAARPKTGNTSALLAYK